MRAFFPALRLRFEEEDRGDDDDDDAIELEEETGHERASERVWAAGWREAWRGKNPSHPLPHSLQPPACRAALDPKDGATNGGVDDRVTLSSDVSQAIK